MMTEEMKDELKGFAKVPGELVMACMLMAGVDLMTLASWGRSMDAPLVSDFARAIVNAPEMADEEQVLGVACELLEAECPELSEYLGGAYHGNNDADELPF